MSGDVVLLVRGVGIGSCGLVHAAEGGDRREVQIEDDLGSQLRREHVERAEGVHRGESESRRVLGAIEGAAPLEIGGSGFEMFKMRYIRGCQPRDMCGDELCG